MKTKTNFIVKGMLYAILFTKSGCILAQDTLYYNREKSQVVVEVLEVNDRHVIFKKYEKLNSPVFQFDRRGFDKLVYSDGSIEYLLKFSRNNELIKANRQFLKGGYLIGGSTEFDFLNRKQVNDARDEYSLNYFSFQPQIAHFIGKNIALGVMYSYRVNFEIQEIYNHPKTSKDTHKSTIQAIGPFLRSTRYLTDHSAFYLQTALLYGSGNESVTGTTNYENRTKGIGMSLRSGVSLFLSDKFMIDFGIGGVDLTYMSIVRKQEGVERKFSQNNVSASLFNISFGLFKVIPGSEKKTPIPFNTSAP